MTWPELAYDNLGRANSRFVEPNLVACTGATTADFMTAPDKGGSPEWNHSMGRFDLVTFTFGGDDIGFTPILYQCLGLSRLVSTVENGSADVGTGAESVAPLPSDPGHTCPAASIIDSRITAFAASYRAWLEAVANEVVVPGGNIVVLGYPDLIELPEFWHLWEQKIGSCWGIGTADATELRGLAGDLNATIGAAVAADNALAPNGVHMTFVDVNSSNGTTPSNDPDLFEPSSGIRHNLCSADPWLNGPTVTESLDVSADLDHSFHPNQPGNDAEGALAAAAIEKLHWKILSTTWTNTGSPVATYETLNDVSCTSASFCMAVGTNASSEDNYADVPNGFVGAFGAYRWNGSNWTETPFPAPPGVASGWLDAVSCVSPSYCVATGTGTPPLSASTLGNLDGVAELWNGQNWSNTNFPGANASATGIDCVTTGWCMSILVPGSCVACGGQVSAALWNGSSWQLTPISGLTASGGNAFGLSCPSTSFCMTTTNLDGQNMDSGINPTQDNVSYVYDGAGWHQVPWSDQSVGVAALSCPSATSCVQMADANWGTPGYGGGEVTFLWNGSSWSEESSPVAGGLAFASISCTASTFCVGVGAPDAPAYDSSGNYIEVQPSSYPNAAAAIWNGTTWVQTPTPSLGDQRFSGVSCTSDQCAAVGSTTAELTIERYSN